MLSVLVETNKQPHLSIKRDVFKIPGWVRGPHCSVNPSLGQIMWLDLLSVILKRSVILWIVQLFFSCFFSLDGSLVCYCSATRPTSQISCLSVSLFFQVGVKRLPCGLSAHCSSVLRSVAARWKPKKPSKVCWSAALVQSMKHVLGLHAGFVCLPPRCDLQLRLSR